MQGLEEIITTYLNAVFSQLFTKFVIATVILLIGFIIGRIAGRLIQRVLHEIELNKILGKAGIKLSLEEILSSLATYFIYFITVIWALDSLGLTTTILTMISAAFLILFVISVLLGVKDFFPNIISGFFIYRKEIIRPGDKLKVDNLAGTVKKISLTETEVKTNKGDIIYIPNSTLTRKEIIIKKKNRRQN